MHRFRKKSDAQRSRTATPPANTLPPIDTILPPASDFRTSLILPSLTRRFTLLRAENGDPISLEDMRVRLAEQRARGAKNHITEEEEDIMLEALGRARMQTFVGSKSGYGMEELKRLPPSSHTSSSSAMTSLTPSSHLSDTSSRSSARSNNRRSNNLFGSHVEYFPPPTVIRSRPSTGASHDDGHGRFHSQSNPGETSIRLDSSGFSLNSPNPVTPSRSTPISSPAASDAAPLFPSSRAGRPSPVRRPSVLSGLTPSQITRFSMALQDVLHEFEQTQAMDISENDGNVLEQECRPQEDGSCQVSNSEAASLRKPGSGPPPRVPFFEANAEAVLSESSPEYGSETGVALAWPADVGMSGTAESGLRNGMRPGTVSPPPVAIDPAHRIPGYIPGMHRPVTPRRDLDAQDQIRSNATTPRAGSPPVQAGSSSPMPRGILVNRSGPNPSASRSNSVTGHYTSPLSINPSIEQGNEVDSLNKLPFVDGRWPSSPFPGVPVRAANTMNSKLQVGPGVSPSQMSQAFSLSKPPKPSGSRPSSRKRGNSSSSVAVASSRLQSSSSLSDSAEIGNSERSLDFLNHPVAISVVLPEALHPANGQETLSRRSSMSAQALPDTSFEDDGFGKERKSVHSPSSSASSTAHFGRLTLSPRLNSSMSSLSIGSSYHSSQDNLVMTRLGKRGAFAALLGSSSAPRWDTDIVDDMESGTDESGQPAVACCDTMSYEEAFKVLGVSKEDVLAMQARLVDLATYKANPPNLTNGTPANPSHRQRRSSTPYSTRSAFSGDDTEPGMATESTVTSRKVKQPALTTPPITSRGSSAVKETGQLSNLARSQALLTSVIENLPDPQLLSVFGSAGTAGEASAEGGIPSAAREKALAAALFGPLAGCNEFPDSNLSTISSPASTCPNSNNIPFAEVSSPRRPIPMHMPHDPQLLLDVERKAAAATAALKKSPSLPKLADKSPLARKPTKRINPHQISNPQLVASSTSIDKIPPLPLSPSMTSIPNAERPALNLSQRFKRFRGSIKTKSPVPSDDDLSRLPPKTPPPNSASNARYSPSPLLHNDSPSNSANDLQQWRFPSPGISSPPASAGPQAGIRGLMARLRRPRKDSEGDGDASIPSPHTRPSQVLYVSPIARREPQSAPALTALGTMPLSQSTLPSSTSTDRRATPVKPAVTHHSDGPSQLSTGSDHSMRQLFEAASNLGLDEGALNALLARSMSASPLPVMTTTMATVSTSAEVADTVDGRSATRSDSKRVARRALPNSPMHVSSHNPGLHINRSRSPHTAFEEVPEVKQVDGSTIVRRTLIYPKEEVPSSAEQFVTVRQSVSSHKRANSGSSNYSVIKSLRDRAPTPPPTRAISKRLSGGPSPPLPALPPGITARTGHLLPPLQLSESQRVSVGGDRRPVSAQSVIRSASTGDLSDSQVPSDTGLEVLELSNGQVIWSVVDGLRAGISDIDYEDDDRSSFISEFSTHPPSRDEAVQLFIRGHKRNGSSKGSGASYISRRRPVPTHGNPRPETKVYFSSTAQISSLIDSISRGLESGSFNIVPSDPTSPHFGTPLAPAVPSISFSASSSAAHTPPAANAVAITGHQKQISFGSTVGSYTSQRLQKHASVNSSDSTHWTVEERLDHMLNSVVHSTPAGSSSTSL